MIINFIKNNYRSLIYDTIFFIRPSYKTLLLKFISIIIFFFSASCSTDNLDSGVSSARYILAPTIVAITPNYWYNAGSVDVTNLSGMNFKTGVTVKLVKTGEADIVASDVVVVSSTKITCTFDMTGAQRGTWDVVVTNADSGTATLASGFRVTSTAAVAPLLSTTWNQGCYYNGASPVMAGGACGRAYTGCNATALAQIMKFWQHPAAAWGGSLTSATPPQTVDYDTAIYNWAAMPASLSSANAEVAKIMLHAGVAVDMSYSTSNSTSFFNSEALKKYFKYSLSQTYVLRPADTAQWKALLKAELDSGRVIFVKGGAHYYLIDGYNVSDNFHCNFGWGGTYDGYYDISSVVPGGNDVTPGSAVTGIKPLTSLEALPVTITASSEASSLLSFEFASLNSWTISTDQAWLSPNTASGPAGYYNWQSGATASVLANPAYTDRYGSLTITSGAETTVIYVKQTGIVPVLAVTPNLLNYAGSGGSLTVTVTSEAGWTATSADSWISLLPPSGTGNGSVSVTADICGPVSRTGSVLFTRGGLTQTVTVDQAALGASWCVPALVISHGNGVTRVAFNTLDRVSAYDEGYVNTGMGTTLNAGSSYTLNVTFFGSNAPAVWIDWNQNGLFTDPGEAIVPPGGSWYPSFAGTKSISVSVPITALDGLTRMRVYAKTIGSGPASGPCATSENGGCIEDYDIFVINP